MALSNPRPLVDFMDRLQITDFEWSVRESRQIDGQGSGQILEAEIAPDLWTAKLTVSIDYHDGARQTRALLNSLVPVGRFALIYDPIAKYPAYDPDGTILGANTVAITAVGADRDTLAFSGFPAGYQLRPGDKIELQYASDPLRRQIVEVSEFGTANGAGVMSALAVYQHVRPAVTTAAVVNLKKPALKMMRMAHSAGTSRAVFHDGMSIEFIEKVV